mmetsp:Transcript_21528/g.51378  ORF Transcript_21528/g.51378 Transcript_21528/m.51378 type:complete len:158 (-) Transcript_21528:297-770(-)
MDSSRPVPRAKGTRSDPIRPAPPGTTVQFAAADCSNQRFRARSRSRIPPSNAHPTNGHKPHKVRQQQPPTTVHASPTAARAQSSVPAVAPSLRNLFITIIVIAIRNGAPMPSSSFPSPPRPPLSLTSLREAERSRPAPDRGESGRKQGTRWDSGDVP